MRELKSEKELIASWKGDPSKPLISVICTAYNHEAYIKDALEGVLTQETNFPFEIVIHDDASLDNTASYIVEYRDKYPTIIKCILQQENQYINDKQAPLRNCLNSAKAELIALCEGDDFWINTGKLQLQFEALQKNPEIAMAVTPGYMGVTLGVKNKIHGFHGDKTRTFKEPSCVLELGKQFAPTASYVVRRDTLNFLYDKSFKEIGISDLFIELYAIRDGGIIYLPVVSSFYRVANSGSWSSNMSAGGVSAYENYILRLNETVRANAYLRSLDWGFKFSYIYIGMALISLGNNDVNGFLMYCKKSKEIKAKKGLKFHVFYMLARFPRLLMLVNRFR